MKQLFCLTALALVKSVACLNHYDESTCEHLKLVADKLGLLEEAVSSNPERPKPAEELPCGLPWKTNQMIMKEFDDSKEKDYSRKYMNEDLAVSVDTMEERTLMISGKRFDTWKEKPLILHLNGRRFRLVGGIHKGSSVFGFTFDPLTNKAYMLEPSGQEELTVRFCWLRASLSIYKGHCVDHDCNLERLVTLLQSLTPQHQKEILDQNPFKILLYRDFGPVIKPSEFDGVPLCVDQISDDEFNIPDGIVTMHGTQPTKSRFKEESLSLIRLVQVIKHFKTKVRPDTPLEGTIVEDISKFLDTFDKDWTEDEKDLFAKGVLLRGIELLCNPFERQIYVPDYINALIVQDPRLKDLFLIPDSGERPPLLLYPEFPLDRHIFPEVAREQILPHGLIDEKVPQSLGLRIGKEKAIFKLFAFIGEEGTLHVLEENGKYMKIETHGRKQRTQVLNLELEFDRKGNPTSLHGKGVAFYHYYNPVSDSIRAASQE